MAQCITDGCTKQVRTGARCPMHGAEYRFEATDFDERDELQADAEDDWVVVQQGLDGDSPSGQTTLDRDVSKEESRRC